MSYTLTLFILRDFRYRRVQYKNKQIFKSLHRKYIKNVCKENNAKHEKLVKHDQCKKSVESVQFLKI